jgi:hypothetical protein
MKCQIGPELVASKEDEVETKPAGHGDRVWCKGGYYKGVNKGKKEKDKLRKA